MTSLVLILAFSTIFLKPYKERPANITAILSYAASICIAAINIIKSSLIAGKYKSSDLVRTVLIQLNNFEYFADMDSNCGCHRLDLQFSVSENSSQR